MYESGEREALGAFVTIYASLLGIFGTLWFLLYALVLVLLSSSKRS